MTTYLILFIFLNASIPLILQSTALSLRFFLQSFPQILEIRKSVPLLASHNLVSYSLDLKLGSMSITG